MTWWHWGCFTIRCLGKRSLLLRCKIALRACSEFLKKILEMMNPGKSFVLTKKIYCKIFSSLGFFHKYVRQQRSNWTKSKKSSEQLNRVWNWLRLKELMIFKCSQMDKITNTIWKILHSWTGILINHKDRTWTKWRILNIAWVKSSLMRKILMKALRISYKQFSFQKIKNAYYSQIYMSAFLIYIIKIEIRWKSFKTK